MRKTYDLIIGHMGDSGHFYCTDCTDKGDPIYYDNSAFEDEICDCCGKHMEDHKSKLCEME